MMFAQILKVFILLFFRLIALICSASESGAETASEVEPYSDDEESDDEVEAEPSPSVRCLHFILSVTIFVAQVRRKSARSPAAEDERADAQAAARKQKQDEEKKPQSNEHLTCWAMPATTKTRTTRDPFMDNFLLIASFSYSYLLNASFAYILAHFEPVSGIRALRILWECFK
jgi:hypothetical protein